MSDADLERRQQAAHELNDLLSGDDGGQIVESFCQGLDLLRDQLYIRVHEDVERVYGADSMLVPVSKSTTERATKLEIEIYQVATTCVSARDFGYFARDDERLLPWLTRLRLGEDFERPNVRERLDAYLEKEHHPRRLLFLDLLSRTARQARHAPLIMFQLYPRAIQVVVATAFNDLPQAEQIRAGQIAILPAIAGCATCRGKILPNGTQCASCGNPLWSYGRMNLVE